MSEEVLNIKILTSILEEILSTDNLAISNDTTAAEVDGWDSLNHVRVVLKLEKVTGKKVPLRIVNRAENVGQLIHLYNSF